MLVCITIFTSDLDLALFLLPVYAVAVVLNVVILITLYFFNI